MSSPEYSAAYYKKNRDRYQKQQKAYYKANKAKKILAIRDARLIREYGLSIKQYNAILETQGGVCAICGGTDKRALSVDHDHETGEIRGLLCLKCNSGIGMLKDDVDLLKAAVSYLLGFSSASEDS